MDLLALEYDRDFVIEAMRQGQLDYLEHVSEAAETDFFRHLIGRGVLARLAEHYPTPRHKEEVPVWFYVASQISLRLHGAAGYHAFPYVLRSGGLITALGPEVGRQAVSPAATAEVSLSCRGFNRKNRTDRQTPCHQDFLRKFARDTGASLLHDWFNAQVPRALRSLKLFDPEGLFIGDASYLFVPDNEHYENSVKLLFDEHHHPVDPKSVDLKEKRYQWHRCYKMVTLLHVNRALDYFLVTGARIVSGNKHECPLLYELVDEFVRAAGKGVMKVLIVDRGLLDGRQMGRLKQQHHIDTVIPLRQNMDAYTDVMGLTRQKDFPWRRREIPPTPQRDGKDGPRDPVIEKRELKRQQTLASRKGLPPPQSLPQPQSWLGMVREVRSWSECPVPLTAVINRDIDRHGEVREWVLVTTATDWTAEQARATYEIRPAIEERHRQYKCFWDLTRPSAQKFSLIVAHVLFVLLSYTFLQGYLYWKQRREENQWTRSRLLQRLSPTLEVVAVYYQQRFCFLLLPEFAEILLTVAESAREKLVKKMRHIKRDIYHLLHNVGPP